MRRASPSSALAFAAALSLATAALPACGEGGGEGLYARFELQSGGKPSGAFTVRLDYKGAPMVVEDFVGLAAGKLDAAKGRPFYDGTAFLRVVPGQFVQGGDPTGTGTGGPGFVVPDEFAPGATHGAAGVLSMITNAPNYIGSQFVVTLGPRKDWDGRYSPIGTVVEGLDSVDGIKQGDVLAKLAIEAKGGEAEAYLAAVSQADFDARLAKRFGEINAEAKKASDAQLVAIKEKYPDLLLEPEGILTKVLIPGSGPTVPVGARVKVSYELSLADGQVLDSTLTTGKYFEFTAGETEGSQGVIEGWDIGVRKMAKGERRIIVVPPMLAYGGVGIPDAGLPPDSYLIFDVEVQDFAPPAKK